MISHANILHNLEQLRKAENCAGDEVFISWLPPYHDMGLIQGILVPLYTGAQAHLLSPLAFLKSPRIWLHAISSAERSVISAAPNFAYDYCVNKILPDQRGALDLSRWKLTISGAEPVHAETLEKFAAAFASAGFSPNAFCPGYGLAEATLFVSGSRPGMGARIICVSREDLLKGKVIPQDKAVGKGMELVGSGIPRDPVLIVSQDNGQILQPNRIEEIYHSSASVAQGYWNRDSENAEIFHNMISADGGEKRYLKTGDLGFISEHH